MKFISLLITFFLLLTSQAKAAETALEVCLRTSKAHPDVCTQSERFHIDTLAQLEAAWKKVYPNKPMPNNLVFPKESQAAKEYAAYLEKQEARKKKTSTKIDEVSTTKSVDDTPAEKQVGVPGKILPQEGDDSAKLKKNKSKADREKREDRIRLGSASQKDLDDHEKEVKRAADRAAKKAAHKSEHKASRTKPKLPKVVQHKGDDSKEHGTTTPTRPARQVKHQEQTPSAASAVKAKSPSVDDAEAARAKYENDRKAATDSSQAKSGKHQVPADFDGSEIERKCIESGVSPKDCRIGVDPHAASNKAQVEKCEKFEKELSAQYDSARAACAQLKDETFGKCFEMIRADNETKKSKSAAQLIEEKNALIRSSLEEFDFRDFGNMKAQISKDNPEEANAKIRLLDSLQKLHDLDKNEVVIASLKSCRDDKCKIEAYNSQLRYLHSQIQAELARSRFLTGMPTEDKHPFFITNAKDMVFNASAEIPVPGKTPDKPRFNGDGFISSLQKWSGSEKSADGVNQKACCHSGDKGSGSFWCSKDSDVVVKSALHKSTSAVAPAGIDSSRDNNDSKGAR